MANITQKGRALAQSLNPSVGTTQDILETCSLLCRHATSYSRIQEMWCSVELSDRQTAHWEHQEENHEKHIKRLCEALPQIDGQSIRPKFGGDPRGATVKLVMPDGRFDDWGQEGICVPGS